MNRGHLSVLQMVSEDCDDIDKFTKSVGGLIMKS